MKTISEVEAHIEDLGNIGRVQYLSNRGVIKDLVESLARDPEDLKKLAFEEKLKELGMEVPEHLQGVADVPIETVVPEPEEVSSTQDPVPVAEVAAPAEVPAKVVAPVKVPEPVEVPELTSSRNSTPKVVPAPENTASNQKSRAKAKPFISEIPIEGSTLAVLAPWDRYKEGARLNVHNVQDMLNEILSAGYSYAGAQVGGRKLLGLSEWERKAGKLGIPTLHDMLDEALSVMHAYASALVRSKIYAAAVAKDSMDQPTPEVIAEPEQEQPEVVQLAPEAVYVETQDVVHGLSKEDTDNIATAAESAQMAVDAVGEMSQEVHGHFAVVTENQEQLSDELNSQTSTLNALVNGMDMLEANIKDTSVKGVEDIKEEIVSLRQLVDNAVGLTAGIAKFIEDIGKDGQQILLDKTLATGILELASNNARAATKRGL